MNPDMLLAWCQRQVALYDVQIENMSSSWRNGIALSSILHRYRPDLIDVDSMKSVNIEKNNNLVSFPFDFHLSLIVSWEAKLFFLAL